MLRIVKRLSVVRRFGIVKRLSIARGPNSVKRHVRVTKTVLSAMLPKPSIVAGSGSLTAALDFDSSSRNPLVLCNI